MHTVVIADQQPIVRLGIRTVLEQHGYHVVDEVGTGVDAIKSIRENEPSLVVMDLYIPQLDGISVIRRTPPSATMKYLIVTMMSNSLSLESCIKLGVSGVIRKDIEVPLFVDAINAIKSGHSVFPDAMAYPDFSSKSSSARLSLRERIILEHIVSGKRNKDIADLLLLSEKTISTYKARINKKLGTHNLVELINITKSKNIL